MRSIMVIYHPASDHRGNYMVCINMYAREGRLLYRSSIKAHWQQSMTYIYRRRHGGFSRLEDLRNLYSRESSR